jgi:hypothetical protein
MIRVTQVRCLDAYRLALRFSDGSEGVADLEGELVRPRLAPLRDLAVFAQAQVAEHTVSWPGELDLAPERLYALAHGLPVPKSLEQAQANERTVMMRPRLEEAKKYLCEHPRVSREMFHVFCMGLGFGKEADELCAYADELGIEFYGPAGE